MKKILLVVALLAAPAGAEEIDWRHYFRLTLLKPNPVAGALLAPEDLKQTELTGLYPVWGHSPRDGCLFPSVVCEDWSPLAVGGSVNAGEWSFVVGPIFNVLPWMQSLALALVPESMERTRAFFAPRVSVAPGDVTFSAGPMWLYKSSTDKGYYRTFAGTAVRF